MGTKALKVLKNEGGRVLFEALEQIYPQDVFEIDKENSFSSGSAYAKGSRFTVNLPKKYRLEKGRVLVSVKVSSNGLSQAAVRWTSIFFFSVCPTYCFSTNRVSGNTDRCRGTGGTETAGKKRTAGRDSDGTWRYAVCS